MTTPTKLLLLSFLMCLPLFSQNSVSLKIDNDYQDIKMDEEGKTFNISLKKGKLYAIYVLQKGVDVVVHLEDYKGNELIEMDSPNGANGYEKFEYTSKISKPHKLKITAFPSNKKVKDGSISILVKHITKKEIKRREAIRRELVPENKKNVQTLDIDHFWQAFDNLENCKTKKDSIASFKKLYFDRATDGFKQFIKARSKQLNPEHLVATIAKYPKFYNSIRENTLKAKEAEPLIEEVFEKFSTLYSNFKPLKVCFAIGAIGTGGTTTKDFVLIGTEISTSTIDVDLSEFKNNSMLGALSYEGDIVQKIKNIVAHEAVHTQQRIPNEPKAVKCHLLQSCIKEGAADFIGELIVGESINKFMQQYGDKNEKQLWQDLKNELCKPNIEGWLYNYTEVKDKPADLGYYMGYKIAQEYYKNAKDKSQAIIDIIEMNNSFKYLEKSGYDKKFDKK